ncbi:MAG: class I SAM-dependent methyltransferase [Vicinamibacterales bacterium]
MHSPPPMQAGSSVDNPQLSARVDALAYDRMASVYDWLFGLSLQPGRLAAARSLSLKPGDVVLEVGVGTGLNAPLYPADCCVVGVDFSASMLTRAERRLAARRITNVHLFQMDATDLKFADATFDVVYAPYLVTAVPDPVQVAREMVRVCVPGGRIVMLNHFLSRNPAISWVERQLATVSRHCGFRSDLDMDQFLERANLDPVSVEQVNFPPIWSLVICHKPS